MAHALLIAFGFAQALLLAAGTTAPRVATLGITREPNPDGTTIGIEGTALGAAIAASSAWGVICTTLGITPLALDATLASSACEAAPLSSRKGGKQVDKEERGGGEGGGDGGVDPC